MAVTYGFYNSLNGDRKYNAKQFGSIFDGVIHDGVYMSIGGRMMVQASGNGMVVNIQTGRAWFNHTWTLNDTVLNMTLPNAEALLSKYIAVILEVNESTGTRANAFKLIAGTPASSPVYPTLTNDTYVHQYPLAYVLIRPGVTTITQADITNMVGTSACPFVTGVVQSMNIDALIAQWQTQWNQWLAESKTEYNTFRNDYNTFRTNFTNFMSTSEQTFTSFMETSGQTFDSFMSTKQTEFLDFVDSKDDEFSVELNKMKASFSSFWDDFQRGMIEYLDAQENIWETWFERIKGQLSEDAATHLQEQIDALSYAYVSLNRAILGNTAIKDGDRAVFNSLGYLDGNRIVIGRPVSP